MAEVKRGRHTGGSRMGADLDRVAMAPVTDVPAKFARPHVSQVVDRPRLQGALTASLDCPVAVVAAPAGWGKTLLAAPCTADGAGGRATAWVSLDAGDDDPRAFWHTVARALLPVTGPAGLD